MADNYLVYWYPTVFHTELSVVSPKQFSYEAPPEDPYSGAKIDVKKRYVTKGGLYVIEADLCDSKDKQYHVTVELDPQTGSITVTGRAKGETLTLVQYGETRRNGFVVYRYASAADGKTNPLENVLQDGIYHLAKSFYHVHELQNGGDSVLRSYSSDDKHKCPELDKLDNEPLKHFLKLYEKKFIFYAQYISEMFAEIEQRAGKEYHSHKANVTSRPILNDTCENAIVEYTYCKALFESRYNLSTRLDTHLHLSEIPEEHRDLYKVAVNIENSLRYIRYVKEKNWNSFLRYSMETTDGAVNLLSSAVDEMKKSDHTSLGISIALGLLSIILTIILSH